MSDLMDRINAVATCSQLRPTGWQVMLRLAEKQTQIVADERPVLRFLAVIGEQLVQGKLRSEPLRNDTGEAPDEALRLVGSPDGELLGWHDRDYFWFLPSFSYNFVAAYSKHEGRYFATKELALRKALAEEGLLEAEEGRSTVTIRVDGQVHRVLRLRRAPLEKLWGEK